MTHTVDTWGNLVWLLCRPYGILVCTLRTIAFIHWGPSRHIYFIYVRKGNVFATYPSVILLFRWHWFMPTFWLFLLNYSRLCTVPSHVCAKREAISVVAISKFRFSMVFTRQRDKDRQRLLSSLHGLQPVQCEQVNKQNAIERNHAPQDGRPSWSVRKILLTGLFFCAIEDGATACGPSDSTFGSTASWDQTSRDKKRNKHADFQTTGSEVDASGMKRCGKAWNQVAL